MKRSAETSHGASSPTGGHFSALSFSLYHADAQIVWTPSTPQLFNTIEHVTVHQYFSNPVFSEVFLGLPSFCPKNTIAYIKLLYAN